MIQYKYPVPYIIWIKPYYRHRQLKLTPELDEDDGSNISNDKN